MFEGVQEPARWINVASTTSVPRLTHPDPSPNPSPRPRPSPRPSPSPRPNLPKVAIVGYTNAGKSTLLNQLCSSDEVYADDLLFATLDPTTRRVALPGGKEVLVMDTGP